MAPIRPAIRSLIAAVAGTALLGLAGCAAAAPAPTVTPTVEPEPTETTVTEPDEPTTDTIEVWNDEGTIGLRVPAGWNQTDSSFEADQGWEAGLLAGPDLAAVYTGVDVVKVRAVSRATDPASYTQTLLAQQAAGGCEIITESLPYADGVYSGVAGSADCSGVLEVDFIYVVLGFSADDGSSSGYLALQLDPGSPDTLVDDILTSFLVDFGA